MHMFTAEAVLLSIPERMHSLVVQYNLLHRYLKNSNYILFLIRMNVILIAACCLVILSYFYIQSRKYMVCQVDREMECEEADSA